MYWTGALGVMFLIWSLLLNGLQGVQRIWILMIESLVRMKIMVGELPNTGVFFLHGENV